MYFIFDFDGTIIEKMKIDYQNLKNELKQILDVDNITPMYDIINKNLQKKDICFKIIDKYELEYLSKIKINKDILKLYQQSNPKIILSRNGSKIISEFLKKNNLEQPVFISCRDNCLNLKPHLEQIQIIFNTFKYLNKDNICIVGDSWHDKQISKNIGCNFKQV